MTSGARTAILKSHLMRSRIEVYDGLNGSVIFDSVTNSTSHQGVVDGEVNAQDESIRRRLSTRIVDGNGSLTPSLATDIFTPYGNEIKAYRAIWVTSESRWEEWPLGVFLIADVEVDDPGGGLQITITGYDRARRVQDSKVIQDHPIGSGVPVADAIKYLISSGVTGLQYNFSAVGFTTPSLVVPAGADRWEAARNLARDIGHDLYFDVRGTCILAPILNYSTQPESWTYAEGSESTILSVNKRNTREDSYNYYIVTGENPNNEPVRGDASDDYPHSPTYWRGKYGLNVAPMVSSKSVVSAAQAQVAAQGLLQKSIGQRDRIHFNAIVNPAHEVGDVIHITRAKSKVDNKYVIQQLAVPLTHARAMDCVTRRRTA